MNIEFDAAKDGANQAKHGVSLSVGEYTVSDPACQTLLDDRFDYAEERYIAIGSVQGRVLVAVYTMRGDVYRFISVRKANAREERTYYARR